MQWSFSKVFNIYKKGDRLDTGNYRGLSILVALAKLCDLVLSRRFNLWYVPKCEQTGAQKGRGCEEQILTIRLLIDIARKSKRTLYIALIDYQKAYDKVNRWKLFRHLDLKGCGTAFLQAVAASMKNSLGTIGREAFSANAGVRQGASISCPLFTFFIESTIDAIATSGPDGWLGNLQTLLLMNDTVILATSRKQMYKKLKLLKTSADDIGMVIHPTKSHFMCVNSTDNEDVILDNANICYTDSYTYLGTPISCSSVSEQVQQHLNAKSSQVLKFNSIQFNSFILSLCRIC